MKRAACFFLLALFFTGCMLGQHKLKADGKQNQPPVMNDECKDDSDPEGFEFYFHRQNDL